MTRPAHVSWLTWQVWGLRDLRDSALCRLQSAGVPALALVPLSRVPQFLGMAEYACKMELHQAPLMVLDQAEREATRWLD